MKFKKLGVLLGAAVLAFGLVAAGCSTQGTSTPSQKVLKVGTDATYPPFGFKDEKTGKLVGFDIDIIEAIAKEENLKVEVKNMNFDGLLLALKSDSLDVVISDMTITKERAQQVDFSQAYYVAGAGLVVQAKNTDIHSFKDLEGKRIGVSIGSTGAEVASQVKGAKVREFNTIVDAFLELSNGGVDVVINDTPVNQHYVNTKGKGIAKTVGEDYDPQPLGIAVKKGNAELLKKIDSGLKKIKDNGEYEKIYKKWFNEVPPKEGK